MKLNRMRRLLPARFRALYLAPVLALVALLAWSLASPMGASPDDDYHLVSTWCANSARTAECAPGTSATSRVVPEALVRAPCFAHEPKISGACQKTAFNLDPTPTELTERGNFQGAYPPLYYATMNLFTGPNILLSVFIMRVVSVLLFLGLTVALFLLLPRDRKPTLVWGWAISTVPLGLFLIASNNPSGWAITGIGSAWIALLGYFETSGRRKIGLGIVFGIAALMAAGSRGDSAIYLILAIAAVIFLAFRREKTFYLDSILPLALVIVAVVFFLSARQTLSGIEGFSGVEGFSGGSGQANSVNPSTTATDTVNPLGLLFSNLANVQSLWAGVLGSWGLGWFDTPMPAIVAMGSLASFVGIVFVSLGWLTWRKGLVMAGIGVVLWVLPVYVLTKGLDPVGVEVQPRYLLPIIVMLAGVAMLSARGRPVRVTRVQWILVASALTLAQALALYFTMRRFVNGGAPGGFYLDSNIKWWWDIPFSPMLVLALGSLAYGGLVFIVLREVTALATTEAPAREVELSRG